MMSKPDVKEGQEAGEFLRHLSNVDTSNTKALTSFYQYLTCNAKNIGSFANRIENTLLNYLNPKNASCSSQKNMHSHFCVEEITKQRKLHLLAACFSLVPTLGKSQARGTRFVDFQLHIIHGLCSTMTLFLECHGITHTGLSSLSNHLTQNTKSFPGLSPLISEGMPSHEFLGLLFARIQFFILSLRHMFELGDEIDNYFCLPAIVSLFNGVFSSKLTDSKRSSNKLLFVSSQLMLTLSSICRNCGANIAPASTCILTLLTYQLEWSQDWYNETKFYEGLIRLRLAVLSCFKDILPFVLTFSRMSFVRLLPRFLQQVVNDLMRASNLNTDALSVKSTESLALSDNKSQSIDVQFPMKQKILWCNFVLIERLFENQTLKSWARTINHCDYTSTEIPKDNSDLSNSVQRELSRLELCVQHLLDEIIGKLSREHKSSIFNSFSHHNVPLLHPQLLSSIARAASSMVSDSLSSNFQKKVDIYLNNLVRHPDTEVSFTALKCSRRVSVSPKLLPLVCSQNEHPTLHSNSLKSCNSFIQSDVDMNDGCNPITEPVTTDIVNKCTGTFDPELEETTDDSSSKAKQPRLTVGQDKDITNPTDSVNPSSIDNLLTDFDPTFA